MLMESQVKFCSPQNISGASQQNRVAAFSETSEVAEDLMRLDDSFTAHLLQSKSPEAPRSQTDSGWTADNKFSIFDLSGVWANTVSLAATAKIWLKKGVNNVF